MITSTGSFTEVANFQIDKNLDRLIFVNSVLSDYYGFNFNRR